MDNKFGLTLEALSSIQKVFSDFPEIGLVIIYGSRAKGNYKKGSDIDFTLKAAEGVDLDLTLQFQVENALDELMLPYLFDISIMDNIDNPNLIDHINRVGQVFYRKTVESETYNG